MNNPSFSTFLKDFKFGLSTWADAWRIIFKHNLLHFFLYPILVSIVLGMGVIAVIWNASDWLNDYLLKYLEYEALPDGNWWQKFLEVLSNLGTFSMGFIIFLVCLFIYHRAHKYVVLATMSPVMSVLSDRVDEILTGVATPFDGKQFVRDVFRGIALSLRNLFLEMGIGLLLWMAPAIISLLTFGIGAILSPLIMLIGWFVSAYFYGFSAMDYSNERKRRSIQESVAFIRKHRGVAIGNGLIFDVFMMIPFVGMPIGVVSCTVGATIAMHRLENTK